MKSMLASLLIVGAVLAAAAPNAVFADRDRCISQCRTAHNQCRMAAKAVLSPQCDAALQSCLDRCSGAR